MEIVLNEITLTALLGFIVVLTFTCMNLFTKSLEHKSYDDALEEVRRKEQQERNNGRGSPKKKSNRKTPPSPAKSANTSSSTPSPKKKEQAASVSIAKPSQAQPQPEVNNIVQVDEEEEASPSPPPPPPVKAAHPQTNQASNKHGRGRFKRAESLRNDHVVFADELTEDTPQQNPPITVSDVEGILQNRCEKPVVDTLDVDSRSELNTFDARQPLDDLQLLRRKSIQITPTGSKSNSKHGSRTDLDVGGEDESPTSSGHQQSQPKVRLELPNATGNDFEEPRDIKKLGKTLKKLEMTEDEIKMIIDIMVKKEEQSGWISSNNAKNKKSVLLELKKDIEAKDVELREIGDQLASLQSRLKVMRSEFTEERQTMNREKRELESELEKEKGKASRIKDLEGELKKEREEASRKEERIKQMEKDLKGSSKKAEEDTSSADEISELKEKLRLEREETAALEKSVKQQQGVINAALKRIYPSMKLKDGSEICKEHQDLLEEYVNKVKEEEEDGEKKAKDGEKKKGEEEEEEEKDKGGGEEEKEKEDS